MEYGNDSIIQAEAIVDHYVHTSFGIERGSMNMREYCEKNNIKLSVDELYSLSRRAIKSINYRSWERDDIREQFANAISNKTNYHYRWQNGYDNSINCKLGDDGVMRAWYSEEYRRRGNGHYYLALDERHAMFCEND